MTTKPKVPESASAPGSRKSTAPGLGGGDANADSNSSSTKSFDPDKFQAHRVPPGFLGELMSLELPSMPKERIEETMPPTNAEELFAEDNNARPSAASKATTAVEIPRPISLVPKPAASGAKPASTTSRPPPTGSPARTAVTAKSETTIPRQKQPGTPLARLVIPAVLIVLLAAGVVCWLWGRETSPSLATPAVASQVTFATPSEGDQRTFAPKPTFQVEPTPHPASPTVAKVPAKSKRNLAEGVSAVPKDPQKSATLPTPEPPKSGAYFNEPE